MFPLSPSAASPTGLLYHHMHNISPVSSLIYYLSKCPLQLRANIELNEQQEQLRSTTVTELPNKLTLAAGQKYKGDIHSL